ncbi:hypothetical protein AB205_0121030, partial [Aquarana catesbeiana]
MRAFGPVGKVMAALIITIHNVGALHDHTIVSLNNTVPYRKKYPGHEGGKPSKNSKY